MDLVKKIELLLSARARTALPRRNRRSSLDEQEAEILAEIRKALRDVEAEERNLARRLKMEQAEAQQAARRGDRAEQSAHERRAAELEQKLEDESILAINLEEKLAALEEKLALAKEAVENEAGKAAGREAEASKALAQSGGDVELESEIADTSAREEEVIPANFADDEAKMAARKSRLSG